MGKLGVPDALVRRDGDLGPAAWEAMKRHPLEARVIAVADAYDVMVSGRPHRPAVASGAAVAMLGKEAGRRL